MVNCSSSTSGTHRVNLVTNPVISHECFLVGFVLLNLCSSAYGVLIIVPFRLDNVLLALYTFTSFAYHFGVFKSFCSGVCVA
jgi:hypothetical protein